MSKVAKRKHVLLHILNDDSPPTPTQQIVKVLRSPGNNLHAVEAPNGSNFLVSMPMKFRRNVWVKRGDFVLVETITEGGKVKGEIVRILTPELIKCFKRDGVWPNTFDSNTEKSSSDGDPVVVNKNRIQVHDYGDVSSDSTSDTDSDDNDSS